MQLIELQSKTVLYTDVFVRYGELELRNSINKLDIDTSTELKLLKIDTIDAEKENI